MKVLIIDDEIVSLSKMEKLVQSLGHEPITASDGRQGIELWKKTRTNIVITDWVMPEMSGLEVINEIKSFQGSIYTYIIMITSKGSTDSLVTGISAGADDYLTKPFIKEVLAVRLLAAERLINFESRDIVIFTMAKLAEARDPETGNHLERIRYYSRSLAETLSSYPQTKEEVNQLFIDNIFLTSPLHDIGKIGIPDFVLLKPGQFDDKEFEIMKQHCHLGYEALNNALVKYPMADYLKMSADIALSHHERYDGTGYPNNLKGDQIPLAARIVSLADVYDALISKRIYKSALPHDLAKSIICVERGKQFDPMIIDAFLESETQFIEIHNRFSSFPLEKQKH